MLCSRAESLPVLQPGVPRACLESVQGTNTRGVVLNADRLRAGQDTGPRSNAYRGEAQQGRLTRRLREWSADRDEVESEHRRKVSGYSCSSG